MTPEVKNRIAQIRRGEVPEEYKRINIGIMPLQRAKAQIRDICEINPCKDGNIEAELADVQAKMKKYMEELGL